MQVQENELREIQEQLQNVLEEYEKAKCSTRQNAADLAKDFTDIGTTIKTEDLGIVDVLKPFIERAVDENTYNFRHDIKFTDAGKKRIASLVEKIRGLERISNEITTAMTSLKRKLQEAERTVIDDETALNQLITAKKVMQEIQH